MREELSACICDTNRYLKEHVQEYTLLENIEGEIEETDYLTASFIVLIENLIKYHIAGEVDWKCELDDFILAVTELCGIKKYNLPFEKEWFCENDSAKEWISILEQKWQLAQTYLVQIDTDSDSYLFFPLKMSDYEKLQSLSEDLGVNLFFLSYDRAEPRPFPNAIGTFCSKYFNVRSKQTDGACDCCQVCSMHKEWINGWTLCVSNEFDYFRITLSAQDLSIKQLFTVSKYFRLTALQAKERLSAGKEIYVKSALYHTLMTMKILDEMKLYYRVDPYPPQYSLFHQCPKNVLLKDRNNYDKIYFDFDKERRKEWNL